MTDIQMYDAAVKAYLMRVTPAVIYGPTSTAVKQITKLQSQGNPTDQTKWGFITFYRSPVFEFDHGRDNFSAQLRGDRVSYSPSTGGVLTNRYVHNIPINLTYNVDIWAATRQRVQEMALAVLHYVVFTDQVLEVPLNPDGEDARFHMIDYEWTDNSDIENEDDVGRIYRHTISFVIPAVITMTETVKTRQYDLSKILIDVYEGDDIDSETCTKCDFRRIGAEGSGEDT